MKIYLTAIVLSFPEFTYLKVNFNELKGIQTKKLIFRNMPPLVIAGGSYSTGSSNSTSSSYSYGQKSVMYVCL